MSYSFTWGIIFHFVRYKAVSCGLFPQTPKTTKNFQNTGLYKKTYPNLFEESPMIARLGGISEKSVSDAGWDVGLPSVVRTLSE